MNTKKIFPVACFAAFSLIYLPEKLSAQTEGGPPGMQSRASATITFADGTSMTVRSREDFQSIEILPRETVNIRLQLPAQFANTLVAVQALDGGLVSEDVIVAADGTAAMAFQAGAPPGLYRVLLSMRGRSATLHFTVPNQ